MDRDPAFAVWLDRELARYDTLKAAVADLREAGVRATEGQLSEWRRGQTAARHSKRRALYEFFGSQPETDDLGALVRALAAQTAAINALVESLGNLGTDAIRRGVEEALQEAGLPPSGGASRGAQPPAPPG